MQSNLVSNDKSIMKEKSNNISESNVHTKSFVRRFKRGFVSFKQVLLYMKIYS